MKPTFPRITPRHLGAAVLAGCLLLFVPLTGSPTSANERNSKSRANEKSSERNKKTSTTTTTLTTTSTTTTSVPTPSTVVGGREISFQTVFDPATVTPTGQKCSTTSPDLCVRTGFFVQTFTGDITGTGVYASSASSGPGETGRFFAGMILFDNVTVKGCGTGSFVYSFSTTIGESPLNQDTVNPKVMLYPSRWAITNGSDGLKGILGSGLMRADTLFAPTIKATATGTIRCG
jgi:hypothetical protein